MTKRKILNFTSTKKKDNMVVWSNQTTSGYPGSNTYAVQPATLIGGNTYIFPWVATARQYAAGTHASPIQESSRTKSLCYMKGLKENVQIQTNSAASWQWRRICFTMKGDELYSQTATNIAWSALSSQGMVRVVNGIGGTTVGSNFVDLVFDGQNGTDWLNIFTAKTDNQRISVKYDKTRTFNSGGTPGIMRNFKLWHPMNKNLRYDDEENGGNETEAAYSADGKQGMGDYYVVDIFSSGSNTTSADNLVFVPEATLYWHEK